MEILNLYAGIGGNRKLWGDEHNVTAVEINGKILDMYKERFPFDKVVIGDAHEYLIKNFAKFDFIWSSPPCQSHSRTNYFLKGKGIFRYPDMKLYQEIIFLSQFFEGFFCVENVIGYYKPLITPTKIGRHYLWTNFKLSNIPQPKDDIGRMNGKVQKANKKHITERNAVNAELGLHVLNSAMGIHKQRSFKTGTLFNN